MSLYYQRADGFHLGPLHQAGEAELVPAGICDGLVVQLPQTYGTHLAALGRGRFSSVQGLWPSLTALLVIFPSGRGGCWRWSFGSWWHVLRCGRTVIYPNTRTGTVTELTSLWLNLIFLAHFNKIYLEISVSVIIIVLLKISSNQLPIIEAANKTVFDHINTSVEGQDFVSPVV